MIIHIIMIHILIIIFMIISRRQQAWSQCGKNHSTAAGPKSHGSRDVPAIPLGVLYIYIYIYMCIYIYICLHLYREGDGTLSLYIYI